MLKDIKTAFGKSAVYSLGNLSTKVIGLLLIPLYTDQAYLSISDYGALGVLEITAQVLVALMSFTLSMSLSRWYWDDAHSGKQKSIFFTSMVTLLGISIFILAFALPFADSISSLLFKHTDYRYVITLLLINSSLQILITQVQTLLKLQSKALLYSLISILKLTITLVLTVYFIVYQGKRIDGIFEAQLIGSVVVMALLIPFVIKNSRLRFEGAVILEMLNYSLPLMLASISGVFFSVIDRYSLNYMEGLERVGVYNLGYKIASTLKVVVISSVQLALSPMLMKKINDPNNKPFYAIVMTYFSFGIMFCVVGLSLFSLEVIKLASRDILYWESANIVAILAFGFFFGMLKDSVFIGLHVVKKTRILALLIAISSVINLGLNLLLIPRYSIYGAAAGTLIAQMLFFGLTYFVAQKWYKIPYELKRVSLIVLTGIILVVVGFLSNEINVVFRMGLKVILLIAFPFILYMFRFYNPSELDFIKAALKAWRNPSKLKSNMKRLLHKK